MTLTVGSLFSGIGGIDLGLERAGMIVKWHSEIDPYACRVLKKHWPHVPNIGDITEVDWSNIPYVDVIAGGYPCQPFSLAGKRAGENDPRHLWPYFRNAISVLRPRYALLENVRGHLTMGGVSVIADLTALGYDCEWRIISAASVGANHRRDRLIIVAYPNSKNEPTSTLNEQRVVADTDDAGGRASGHGIDQHRTQEDIDRGKSFGRLGGRSEIMADSDDSGLQGRHSPTDTGRQGSNRHIGQSSAVVADTDVRQAGWRIGGNGTDRASVFGRDNYFRGTEGYAGREWWQTEPDVGRVANGIPSRVDRLRGLGNAVVPQVAEVVGRLIVSHAND